MNRDHLKILWQGVDAWNAWRRKELFVKPDPIDIQVIKENLSGADLIEADLSGVDFSGARLDTSNQFARLNPEFPSALTGTYVQPLLRGRTIDLDRRNILVARRAVDLTDAQLSQVVMDQLTLVEEAYWDLAFASGNLVVLTDALLKVM